MSSGLAGRRVLIPRGGVWGDRVLADVHARGAEGVIAPLIEVRAPVDVASRDRVFASLAAGAYDWVFVTSASTVEQLLACGIRVPLGTKVAAVGRATGRALVAAGMQVDFLPEGQTSAGVMIRQWCDAHTPTGAGRCLVLRSDMAMAAVSDELEIQGYRVDVGIAYRTVGVDVGPDVVSSLTSGDINVVLLTSGSVARELQQQVPQLSPDVVLVAIGQGTASAAEKLGLVPRLVSPLQSIESMLDALELFIGHNNAEEGRK